MTINRFLNGNISIISQAPPTDIAPVKSQKNGFQGSQPEQKSVDPLKDQTLFRYDADLRIHSVGQSADTSRSADVAKP